MYRDHQGLLEYLSGSIQKKVDLVLFANYGAMVQAIREGSLELAWLGPLAYLEAESALQSESGGHYELVPIVKPRRRGRSDYAAEIIVRKDSGIDTIGELAGRRLACVDTESTAGHLLAVAHLIKSGISVEDPLFQRRYFVNQYGNVVLSVLFGKYDAGAVFEGAPAVFLKGREKDRLVELNVLTRSDPVPYEPIAAVVGGRLRGPDAERFQRLFLDLEGRPELLKNLQVDGFVRASAAEYGPIREIVKLAAAVRGKESPHAVLP